MEATVGPARPRWWNRSRPWVTLFPLATDDARAVGRLSAHERGGGAAPVPGADRLATEVKGQVRDGGLVRGPTGRTGAVLWPRGRLPVLSVP